MRALLSALGNLRAGFRMFKIVNDLFSQVIRIFKTDKLFILTIESQQILAAITQQKRASARHFIGSQISRANGLWVMRRA